MPSPVYQCKNALRRNMPVYCSATRLNISWIAVLFPTKVTAIFKPLGGMSQTPHFMLFGIHSTKYEEFLFWTLSICSSTSFVDIRPRNSPHAVKYRPCLGSAAHIMFFASNVCCVSSGTVSARYCCEPRDVQTREWNEVHRQLPEVGIQLPRESEAGCHSTHCRTHKMVQ